MTNTIWLAGDDGPVRVVGVCTAGTHEVYDITVDEDESYCAAGVFSHNSSSSNPNLQNIPERHPERAALIKRQFIAARGRLYLKRDFSAHETRLLGIAARDGAMADSFWNGKRTRLAYQHARTIPKDLVEAWKKRLWMADPHVQNYGRLYSVDAGTVTPKQRKGVKAVIFGVTYGKGIKTLAGDIGSTEEEAQKVFDLIFKKTFRVSGDWLDSVKARGRKRVLVNNILGGVRHLWGYLHPERRVKSAMDRRGPNSAIQGTASNLGFVGAYFTRRLLWELFESRGIEIGLCVCNAVHDSTEMEVSPVNIPLAFYLSEHGYTTMIHRWMRDVMGFETSIGFEMDAKVGATLSVMGDATRWDDQVEAVEAALRWGNENLGRDDPVDAIMPAVRSNARILHEIRRREIARQLSRGERVNYHMEMTRENCTSYGLVFETPSKRTRRETPREGITEWCR